VEDWLLHNDVLHNPESQLTRSSSGDWISLSLSVGQLERMLGAKYHVYKHSTTETTVIRTTSYSLPRILHGHITTVSPSTYFGHPKPQHKPSFVEHIREVVSEDANGATNLTANHLPRAFVSPTCKSKMTPSCLNALYNISYTPVSTDRNSLGVVGYLNEYANHADLQVRRILWSPLSVRLTRLLDILHQVQTRCDRWRLQSCSDSQRWQQPERPWL